MAKRAKNVVDGVFASWKQWRLNGRERRRKILVASKSVLPCTSAHLNSTKYVRVHRTRRTSPPIVTVDVETAATLSSVAYSSSVNAITNEGRLGKTHRQDGRRRAGVVSPTAHSIKRVNTMQFSNTIFTDTSYRREDASVAKRAYKQLLQRTTALSFLHACLSTKKSHTA